MILDFIYITILFYFLNYLTLKSKLANDNLLDNDFKKIQSFHKSPVLRSGGILIFFSILFIFFF